MFTRARAASGLNTSHLRVQGASSWAVMFHTKKHPKQKQAWFENEELQLDKRRMTWSHKLSNYTFSWCGLGQNVVNALLHLKNKGH